MIKFNSVRSPSTELETALLLQDVRNATDEEHTPPDGQAYDQNVTDETKHSPLTFPDPLRHPQASREPKVTSSPTPPSSTSGSNPTSTGKMTRAGRLTLTIISSKPTPGNPSRRFGDATGAPDPPRTSRGLRLGRRTCSKSVPSRGRSERWRPQSRRRVSARAQVCWHPPVATA